MSPHYFCKKILTIFFLVSIFTSTDSFAWTGYDNSDGSEIEIGGGNLVREGEEIKFYDWKSEEDRRAEVKSVEYLSNRVRLEIYDYFELKIRVFDMDN